MMVAGCVVGYLITAAFYYLLSLRILCWAITKGFKYHSIEETSVALMVVSLFWPVLPALAVGILICETFYVFEPRVSSTFGAYVSKKVRACVVAHGGDPNETT